MTLRAGVLKQRVRWQREDLLARRHDLANRHIVQLERAVNERLLKRRQQAEAARGRSNELELLSGVDGSALGHGNIKAAQDDRSRDAQQTNRGADQRHEDQHGGATATASASARRRASDLGTSSPTTTWK